MFKKNVVPYFFLPTFYLDWFPQRDAVVINLTWPRLHRLASGYLPLLFRD